MWASGIAVALAFTHPWVRVYMLPPTIVVALRALHARKDRTLAIGALGVLTAAGLIFAFLPGAWNPAPAFLQNAGPRAWELVTNPRSLFPLPLYVDSFPYMVGWSVLAIAAVCAVTALVRRTTLGLAVLAYTLAILPLSSSLVHVWFIPHRSVAYLSLGLALLVALPVELMGALPEWDIRNVAAAAVIGVYFLAVMAPVAISVQPWYRLYDEDDYEAWRALATDDTQVVLTGSWEAAAGYRAITGEDVLSNPTFFSDAKNRAAWMKSHPGTVALLDDHAREDGVKAPGSWREVGAGEIGRV